MCAYLNASMCHPTVEMSALGHTMVVALYNPLAWPRTEGIRVPLNTSSSKSWTVRGVCDKPFALTLLCAMPPTASPMLEGAPKAVRGQSESTVFLALDRTGSNLSITICSYQTMSSVLELKLFKHSSDGKGKAVKSQLLPISNATADLQSAMLAAGILLSLRSSASHELAFMAELPPLGYTTYTIAEGSDRDSAQPSAVR